MSVEYTVIILPPYPHDAAKSLNKLANENWRVVGVAHDDRVILERERAEFIPPEPAPYPQPPKHYM